MLRHNWALPAETRAALAAALVVILSAATVVVLGLVLDRSSVTVTFDRTPEQVWTCLQNRGYRGDPTDSAEQLTVSVVDLRTCRNLPRFGGRLVTT
ncbi:MAG: hypothetical protein QOG20_2249 [Pseudonocardiales bacterium]|jgi:phenylpyruvate tautomerase PptA (4-oxalocrotonate tautomerase family)|nr:hypothetical protein [Pseudonocardiales bacterium]